MLEKQRPFCLFELEKQDFFIDDDASALVEAREKYPHSRIVTIRIGYAAAYTAGTFNDPKFFFFFNFINF